MGPWAYQMYSVILVQNEEGKDEVAVVEDGDVSKEEVFHDTEQTPKLQISMHALMGTPSQATTFTLKLKVGNRTTTALVDTGSDASFMNAKFAIKANCQLIQWRE